MIVAQSEQLMALGVGQHDVLNDLEEFTSTLKGSKGGERLSIPVSVDRTSGTVKESFKRRSFKESPIRKQACSKVKLAFTDGQKPETIEQKQGLS